MGSNTRSLLHIDILIKHVNNKKKFHLPFLMYDLRQFCEFHEKLLVLLLYDYENWSCDGDDLMYFL